jgi:hypothetical protein
MIPKEAKESVPSIHRTRGANSYFFQSQKLPFLIQIEGDTMSKPKMVKINLEVTKKLVRMLDRFQEAVCIGWTGEDHDKNCPAKGSVQLRNYLTLRVNHPTEDFTI